jgi:hypothetical protein
VHHSDCPLRLLLSVALWLVAAGPSWAKEPSKPDVRATVCVAVVNNRTTTSLMVDRLTERLAKSLAQNKFVALAMVSATTDDRELRPTPANLDELKRLDCDYMVLTQVSNPKGNLIEPRAPSISVGRRTPGTDASDPTGGQSGTAYRDDLEIDFSLFRSGRFAELNNASILAQPSANVADSLVQSMDQVANRVAHELKKK